MASIYAFKVIGNGWTGAPGITTFWGLMPSQAATGSTGECEEFAARIKDCYNTMAGLLANSTSWTIESVVQRFDIPTGVLEGEVVITPPSTVTSSAGANTSHLPRSAMINVNLRTDAIRNGRKLLGRHFIGPACSGTYDNNGLLDSGIGATVITAYNGLLDITGPMRLAVYGRPIPADAESPNAGAAGVHGYVQKVAPGSKPGTLRSRKN